MWNFWIFRRLHFLKIENSKPLRLQKWHFLNFQILRNWFHEKIFVTEKSWNVHTVSFVVHNAEIWRVSAPQMLRETNFPYVNYHFSVTCVIMQKNGAGLHTASSCYWDNSTDGSCTVRWENKTMYCIVSVFGLAIWVKKKITQAFYQDSTKFTMLMKMWFFSKLNKTRAQLSVVHEFYVKSIWIKLCF